MKNNYLDSPVGRTLLLKSLPMFLGIFAHIAYNLVDTYFVGKLGTDELAAMSFSFPVVMIVINISMGIGVGVNSLVSRLLGEKRYDEAKKTQAQGLQFTIILSLVLTLAGFLTMTPLFKLLGVDDSLMPYVKDYMGIWYAGMLCINLTYICGSIFRAKGNVFFPSAMLIAGSVFNGLLDPILIFGWGPFPKMGIQGAALTTVLGNALSLVFILGKLVREREVSLSALWKSISLKIYKKISVIALPTAAANSFVPISTAFTNWLLVAYGHAAVAGNTIATRVETIPFIAIFALCSVFAPFIGQNYGANNFARIREGIKKSFLYSYALGITCAIAFISYKQSIGGFFDDNTQVIEVTAMYFSFVPLTYGILGTVFLSTHALNAIGKSIVGNLLSLSRHIIFYIPLAFTLNAYFGINGVFFARITANTIVGSLSTLLIYRTFFKTRLTPSENL